MRKTISLVKRKSRALSEHGLDRTYPILHEILHEIDQLRLGRLTHDEVEPDRRWPTGFHALYHAPNERHPRAAICLFGRGVATTCFLHAILRRAPAGVGPQLDRRTPRAA